MGNVKGRYSRLFAAVCAAVLAAAAMPVSAEGAGDRYEAEEAVLDRVDAAGDHVSLKSEGSVTFKVEIPESGWYSLNFISAGVGGAKENNALVDGDKVGSFRSASGKMGDSVIGNVYVEKGSHDVTVTPSWGWIDLDALVITASQLKDSYDVKGELSNKNATDSARRLMAFLKDNYGEKTISGQQCDGGLNGSEFKVIKEATGKTPALVGLDLMDYTPVRVSQGASCSSVEKAIEFSQAGGIVEMCWHWSAPKQYIKEGKDANGNPMWWGSFYTANVTMDFDAVMNGEDPEGYAQLVADIDAIAEQLKKLQEADVPVLFRPLHEGSGGWFWWGSGSAESYRKLWVTMYDKLTVEHGLNNLIWVYNGQAKEWYPGDEYVDIIGEDIYPGRQVTSPQSSKFLEAADYTDDTKIVTLSENGCLFDPDEAYDRGTLWSWFCVWNGEFVRSGSRLSEEYSTAEMWKKVYNSEYVLTLDELPDLKNYPLEEGEEAPVEQEEAPLKGDVNLDGDVNVTDVSMTAAHVKGIRALADDSLADVNGDGDVNVTDLSAIAAHVKGIRPL
ncbi:glycosyl hydrolase [Ruminococcus sp.]|uniref:glycosyl hydrolase n=1 Tax=Ruminococcus sp. TaxID=41978 RepID=UPI0025E02E10|nr:glycosyl hydrolase [Ruminococcus sp.]MBQ8965906.1 beta-mannosidase [Ruminococcus sp.]